MFGWWFGTFIIFPYIYIIIIYVYMYIINILYILGIVIPTD